MQKLDHLIKAVRGRLSDDDLELLDFASRPHEQRPSRQHEADDAKRYDQVFDRVLARLRREHAQELQRGYEISS